jgi:hypothetical protein
MGHHRNRVPTRDRCAHHHQRRIARVIVSTPEGVVRGISPVILPEQRVADCDLHLLRRRSLSSVDGPQHGWLPRFPGVLFGIQVEDGRETPRQLRLHFVIQAVAVLVVGTLEFLRGPRDERHHHGKPAKETVLGASGARHGHARSDNQPRNEDGRHPGLGTELDGGYASLYGPIHAAKRNLDER